MKGGLMTPGGGDHLGIFVSFPSKVEYSVFVLAVFNTPSNPPTLSPPIIRPFPTIP